MPPRPSPAARFALAALAAAALAALALGTAAAPPSQPPAPQAASSQPPLPGFALYRTGPHGGTVWQGTIPNLVVPSDHRASEIYLPPGFSSASSYPVLYLLHGTPGSPYSYVNGLHVARIFDAEIANGRVRPFIAVIPPGGLTAAWLGEWTGPWESYVVSDVVPWIDAHLPTLPAPADRAIAGLSAGGYGAVDIGLRHPDVFGTLESWSGYFTAPRDGSLARLPLAGLRAYDPSRLARLEAASLRTAGTRFFVSCATTHDPITAGWARQFGRELSRLDLPHRLLLLPGGHDGAFWLAQLPAALGYAEPPA